MNLFLGFFLASSENYQNDLNINMKQPRNSVNRSQYNNANDSSESFINMQSMNSLEHEPSADEFTKEYEQLSANTPNEATSGIKNCTSNNKVPNSGVNPHGSENCKSIPPIVESYTYERRIYEGKFLDSAKKFRIICKCSENTPKINYGCDIFCHI